MKQPDPAKREALVSLHARTAKCMRAYAGAILRQGVTDEVAARLFVVSHCGKEMHEWTQREEGSTEEESFAILDGLAGAALDAQRRPSAPPSPPPKPARPKEPPIKYDAQQERRRGIYLSFYAQTVACMREAAVAGLRTGSRSRKDLSEFVAGACGGPFSTWLTASPPEGEGRPEKETRAFLIALAYEAINMALRGPDAIIVR